MDAERREARKEAKRKKKAKQARKEQQEQDKRSKSERLSELSKPDDKKEEGPDERSDVETGSLFVPDQSRDNQPSQPDPLDEPLLINLSNDQR